VSELTSKLKENSLLLTSTQEQLSSSEQLVGKLRSEVTIEHDKLVQSEAEVKVSSHYLNLDGWCSA